VGSAADSQHLAAEFTGRFINDRRPLAALALSTDSSALTCIANDYAFEQVFERQLRALGRAGDALVAISTSGNSANVLARGTGRARDRCVGGWAAGPRWWQVDAAVQRGAGRAQRHHARIQEAHIFIGHTLCTMVERSLGVAG